MLVFAVFYWCVDKKYGVVSIISFYVASLLNGLIKVIVRAPRPVDPKIDILYGASTKDTYGFPSGHSQYAASFATVVSLKTHKTEVNHKWIIYSGSVFIALLGGFARIYLGVHFLEDVIVGLILGVLLMLLLVWLIGKIKNEKFYLIFLIPFYVIMIFQHDHSLYGFGGLITAVVVGHIIEKKFINMPHSKSISLNIRRVVCCYPPALVLYVIRYFVLTELHIAIDFLLMLSAGAWLVLLAPLAFMKIPFLKERT